MQGEAQSARGWLPRKTTRRGETPPAMLRSSRRARLVAGDFARPSAVVSWISHEATNGVVCSHRRTVRQPSGRRASSVCCRHLRLRPAAPYLFYELPVVALTRADYSLLPDTRSSSGWTATLRRTPRGKTRPAFPVPGNASVSVMWFFASRPLVPRLPHGPRFLHACLTAGLRLVLPVSASTKVPAISAQCRRRGPDLPYRCLPA